MLASRNIAVTEPRKKDDPLEPTTPGDVTSQCLQPEADPSIPQHHAKWGQALFNAMFAGVAQYRRGEAPCSWVEGVVSFDAAWGMYDSVDPDELEAEATRVPCHETLCASLGRMIEQFGTGMMAMIEAAIARHPEWDLYVDGGRVVWVPF